MKLAIIILFLFQHSLLFASNEHLNELGRSLANYQTCSNVSVSMGDEQMFSYYQSMFNDTRLSLLSFNTFEAKEVYTTWSASEKVLNNIGNKNLQGFCLSRFDELSRQMIDKVATESAATL